MTLTEAVKATYEVVGQSTTDLQLAMTIEELSGYPIASVLAALSRCRRELRKLTLADILDRIPGGHPGPEEAWATIAKGMADESRTLIWSDEMREAYGVARGCSEDEVAARMAFKETYTRAVSEARSAGKSPHWSVSQGTDKADRERAILEGVKKGQLSASYTQRLLPSPEDPQTVTLLASLTPRLLGFVLKEIKPPGVHQES